MENSGRNANVNIKKNQVYIKLLIALTEIPDCEIKLAPVTFKTPTKLPSSKIDNDIIITAIKGQTLENIRFDPDFLFDFNISTIVIIENKKGNIANSNLTKAESEKNNEDNL